MNNREILVIILISSISLSLSLTSNLLYFSGHIIKFDTFSLVFTSAALTYPITFALSDFFAYLTNRKTGIMVGIIFIIADGIFCSALQLNYLIAQNNFYSLDSNFEILSNAMLLISSPIFKLWYFGILASIVTVTIEVLIFSRVMKKINNYILSVVLSTAVTLALHNSILDYNMLKSYDGFWHLIIGNYIVNMLTVSLYAIITHVSIKIISNSKNKTKNIR